MPAWVYSGKPSMTARCADLATHARQPRLDLAAEAAMKQQILGRIARQSELGEQHQIGVELARARRARR